MSQRNDYRFLPQDVWYTVKLWHQNWRRSVGFLKSLCFAMFRWIRVWTTEPPGGISYFDRHAPATLRYAALHSILQNRMQVVASASALRNTWIPPGGAYGKTRSSNIETAKHIDFSKSVSDKTILVSPAHGYSNNLRQKSYLRSGHKKYYGYTTLFPEESLYK